MSPYLAALAILAAGALAGPVLSRRPALALRVGSAASVAGSLVGLASVLPFLLGAPPADLVLPWSEPLGSFHLRLDPLSAFFQAALFAVAVPASAFGAGYMKPCVGRRPMGGFVLAYGLLLVSISLVLSAADGVLFLVAWEVMTIASFVLVTFDDERLQVRRAGFVFLVASHVGTAFLFALFLLLGREAGGFDFVRFEALRGAGAAAPWLLFTLGLVGFGTKAGLVPLHVWLPEAHPAAPSHVSALLSGVMIKTGVYGLLRLLGFLPPSAWGTGSCSAPSAWAARWWPSSSPSVKGISRGRWPTPASRTWGSWSWGWGWPWPPGPPGTRWWRRWGWAARSSTSGTTPS